MSEKENNTFEFEELKDNYSFENVNAPTPEEPEAQPKTNTLSIASMIMGILSCVCCCIGFYPFFSIIPAIEGLLAVVFSGASKKNGTRNGMALAGLICGIIGIVIAIFAIIFWIVAIIAGIMEGDSTSSELL